MPANKEFADLELSPAPDISASSMAISSVPIIVVALVSLYLRLGNVSTLLVASARCVCQLLLLGILLYPIFVLNAWYAVFPYILMMILFATREASVKPKHRYLGMRLHMLLAIILALFCSLSVITSFVLVPDPWWDAQVTIPVAGMMLGSCVNSLSLGMDRFLLALAGSGRGSAILQTYLACGATRWEAALPSIREAIETGMTPNLNQMSVMGLVSIPGMMTGQILGGTPPFVAAKYQIVIMFFVCSNSTVILFFVITQAVFNTLFDKQHRFQSHLVSKRKGGKPKDILLTSASALADLFCVLQKKIVTTGEKPVGNENVGAANEINCIAEEGRFEDEPAESGQPGTFKCNMESSISHGIERSRVLLSVTNGSVGCEKDQLLLSNLNQTLCEGELIVLLGPSGCGKSTYLRALAMLEPLRGGTLNLRGQDVSNIDATVFRSQISYVRQQGGQGLHGTPRDLVVGLCALKSRREKYIDRARRKASWNNFLRSVELRLTKSLEFLDLSLEMVDRRWDLMSGGESQRVYLCVMLALQPAALLLDEPTSACDEEAARKVEDLLVSSGISIVWVSHDPSQIERLKGFEKTYVASFQRPGDRSIVEIDEDHQCREDVQ